MRSFIYYFMNSNDFMNNHDKLQRFLFENAFVRGEIIHLKDTYQQIISQHDYPPIIKNLLGQALVLVALLTAIMKFKGRLTLQFQGKSGVKLLLVQSSQDFQLRALAQWEGELNEADLLAEMRKGILVIMMDPDTSTKRYQGVVSWKGDSLAESIEGYFKDSEQLLTRIWIAVDDKLAAGLLLQALPREGKESAVVGDDEWNHLTILTDTLKPHELLHLETETLLRRLYVEEDIQIFAPNDVMFKCTCTPERGENAILLLGLQEAEEELRLKQVIVVKCDFCGKEYIFDKVDVATIFRRGGNPAAGSTKIH
jgi:molecular chaperone Hsp33